MKCLISLPEVPDHVSFEAVFSLTSNLKLASLSQSDFPSCDTGTFSLVIFLVWS